MEKEPIKGPKLTIAESSERPTDIVDEAFREARIGGSTQQPEIYLRNTKKIEGALLKIGVHPFPDGDMLIINSWHDIGILYDVGLVNFGDDSDTSSAVRDGVVHLFFPDSGYAGANIEYKFPAGTSEKKFPTHSPVEKLAGPDSENRVAPETLRNSQWGEGKEVDETVLREYTKLPNLIALGNMRYKWEKGKLYKLEAPNNLKGERVEVLPEEHYEILRKAQQGDPEALEEIPKIHLGLVLGVVARLQDIYGGEADDMIQAGLEGLLDAVKRYEPSRGRFSTYATQCIDGFIRGQHNATHRLIRRPSHRNKEVNLYYRTARTLEQELGREPRRVELSKRFGMTDKELDRFERENGINRKIAGLAHEDQLTSGHISYESPELLPDLDDPTERGVMRKEFFDRMEEVLQRLKPREIKVLRLRFGLGTQSFMTRHSKSPDNHLTLEEVGNVFNITRERVRQIEGSALRKLRSPTNLEQLREFLDYPTN